MVEKVRVDFVPADLGLTGMIELHSVMKIPFEDGWGAFARHGRVTRLDVAVDFPLQTMEDFWFLPSIGSTSRQWRRDGQLETFTQGKPKSTQTTVYDRKAKRKAQGKAWQGKTGIRVEHRLKSFSKSMLKDLPTLPNPLGHFKIIAPLSKPAFEKKPYIWSLFQAAVEARGLPASLALLPEEKRHTYRQHMTEPAPWWNSEVIWDNWPAALAALKIADADYWK